MRGLFINILVGEILVYLQKTVGWALQEAMASGLPKDPAKARHDKQHESIRLQNEIKSGNNS